MQDPSLHDHDFLLWIEGQARALRERDPTALDWDHLLEEMELMGASVRYALESRLVVLLTHLLKLWVSDDDRPRRGWMLTVREQERRIRRLLTSTPSLRRRLREVVADVYADALEKAYDELSFYAPLDRAAFDAKAPTSPDDPQFAAMVAPSALLSEMV